MTDFFDTVTASDAHREVLDRKGNDPAALGTHAATASGSSSSDEAPITGIVICNANILAIDIGTTTGWALGMRDGALHSGSESFAPRRNDGPGQRWLKFSAWLGERARQAGEIHAVYYELVLRHTAVQAAHVYGGFEAHLQAWADRNRIRLIGVPVSVIKKSWTGRGNANKDAMMAEAKRRGIKVVDDNHCDARALLDYAILQEQ